MRNIMRKRFTTLICVLMGLSLFCTGFAASIVFYPRYTDSVSADGPFFSKPTVELLELDPSEFGIAWKTTNGSINGQAFSCVSATVASGTSYTFRSKTLSAEITVDNTKRQANYVGDCLVMQVELGKYDDVQQRFTDWKTNSNFSAPAVATVGLSDGTVYEKVSVSTVNYGKALEMRIPMAMIYRLAAAQKGATATSGISTLAITLEFEAGVPAADENGVIDTSYVNTVCNTPITFSMRTDYQ